MGFNSGFKGLIRKQSVCGSFIRSDFVPYGYDRAHRYVLRKSPKILAVPQVLALGLGYAYMCQRTCVRAPQFCITTTTTIIHLCYAYCCSCYRNFISPPTH